MELIPLTMPVKISTRQPRKERRPSLLMKSVMDSTTISAMPSKSKSRTASRACSRILWPAERTAGTMAAARSGICDTTAPARAGSVSAKRGTISARFLTMLSAAVAKASASWSASLDPFIKLSQAALAEAMEPSRVSEASLAVVPVIPISSWITWIAW